MAFDLSLFDTEDMLFDEIQKDSDLFNQAGSDTLDDSVPIQLADYDAELSDYLNNKSSRPSTVCDDMSDEYDADYAPEIQPKRRKKCALSSNRYENPNKCMSKAAISARENREKKKQLLDHLRNRVTLLTAENQALKKSDSTMRQQIGHLRKEVTYLRGVIANDSMLSGILKNVVNAPGMKLHAPMNFVGASSTMSKNRDDFDVDVENCDAHSDDSGVVASKRIRVESTESEVASSSSVVSGGSPPSTFKSNVIQPVTRRKAIQRTLSALDHDYSMNNGVVGNPVAAHARAPSRPIVSRLQASNRKSAKSHGVCLHVSGEHVSLEFCAKCAAASGGIADDNMTL